MNSERKIIFVDLDQTLLRTDLLIEGALKFLTASIFNIFIILKKLLQGKVALKNFLYANSELNLDLLPYNHDVLKYLSVKRAEGCKIVLITASDERYAREIANRFEIFDEVHGSRDGINLKGSKKLEVIKELCGVEPFEYVGDSISDLPVWKEANYISVVRPTHLLRGILRYKKCRYHEIKSETENKFQFLKMIRIHQWVKNLLIFLPIFASHEINIINFLLGIKTFVAFSLLASAIYIINDLLDLNSDRLHPEKKQRPIASGEIPISRAFAASIFLILTSLISTYFYLNSIFQILIIYFAVTLLYSSVFKKIIISDVFFLALLYTIRVYAGNVGTNIPVSIWLISFAFFFFLSLGFVKRLTEIVKLEGLGIFELSGRPYNVSKRNLCLSFASSSAGVSIILAILYLFSDQSLELYTRPIYILAACIVVFKWQLRAIFLSESGEMNYDPVLFAIKDRYSILSVITVAVLMIFAI